jgi:hypothetical protein|nr:MAG TPA: hypothetical protein [Caudoviricetes sp.]
MPLCVIIFIERKLTGEKKMGLVTAFVIFVVLSAVFGGGKGKKGKRKSRAGSGQNGYVYSHKNR